MVLFDLYGGLPSDEQLLHGLHFMLCSFAVVIACVPLLVAKGSAEHKIAGLIYVPVSAAALALAAVMAWTESSFLLFSFSGFCAWLLLSGWRAVRAQDAPRLIDWLLPVGLLSLAGAVAWHALVIDEGRRSFGLMFFALNAFYLGWRDLRLALRWRGQARRYVVFAGIDLTPKPASGWMSRHVAGMAGSLMANLSVVVLTLLPVWLHWLWPVMLAGAAVYIGFRHQRKKAQVKAAVAVVLQPGFGRKRVKAEKSDMRRAA